MRTSRAPWIYPVLLLAAGAVLADTAAAPADPAVEATEWRAARLQSLTSPNGWLTLVGLYWLKEGPNSLGRAPGNAIPIDNPALGKRAGAFVLSGGAIRFEGERGSCVRIDDKPVTSGVVHPDSDGEPTLLTCGPLQFFVIARGGQFGVRVRDLASHARAAFHGLDYFPFDPSWTVNARFEPYAPVRKIPIVNVLGMEIEMESPGAVAFERDGHEWRLDALLEGPDADELFLMFADGTSGHETYGAGRFLYTPLPADGHVRVDFNRAYAPPCAFTSFATCPLPPSQNRIALRVAAGELRYDAPGH